MAQPALKYTPYESLCEPFCGPLYEQLMSLPENLVGEIISGQIHTQPRPAMPHALAATRLGIKIGSPFSFGGGGPSGWWILAEPEVHFIPHREVLVPDIAGWRQERLPTMPNIPHIERVPDWICEVLSPSTSSKDRLVKMPIYAQYGVHYAWLVDPLDKTLEAFERHQKTWSPIGRFKNNEPVSAAPFAEISFALHDLWC